MIMTAKDLCEKLKQEEIERYIEMVKAGGGVVHIDEPYYCHHLHIYRQTSDPIFSSTKKKLIELGYKIEEKEIELIYNRTPEVKTYQVKKYKYFGPLIDKCKSIKSKPKYKLFKYITISACCGEKS